MGTPLLLVDAFTDRAFGGNPAAVCLLDAPRDDGWMQSLATEMNQAETAFLLREGGAWRLRWMTPAVEVDLCGHATLAAAHALWTEGLAPRGVPIVFRTRSGELTARDAGGDVVLDFPATPVDVTHAPRDVEDALGVAAVAGGRNARDLLLEVASDEEVRALAPDLLRLRAAWRGGVIVTARSADARLDYVCRFFAPGLGIDEDPVTGSAHCALAPWWGARLGKDGLVGYQASRRGGLVRVRVAGNRVELRGTAVTVLRGELAV